MKRMKRQYLLVGFEILILFVCIFVHIYRITEIPFGINVDEMGMAYDAWSLNNYGVDRYLKSFPVYLTNFGGGQSVLYAYLCTFFLKFADLSVLVIRLPGMLCFFVALFYQCRLAKLWEGGNGRKTFLTLFFMTILPVYIMLFRIGMDCNLMLAFSSVFFFYFVKAIETGGKKYFIMAGITSGILLYTYAISYVVLIAFLCFMLPYLFYTKKITIAKLFYFGIPLGVLALPLILVQFVNLFDWNEIELGKFTITKLIMYRSSAMSLNNLSKDFIAYCKNCIFAYDDFRYNSLPEFGTLYYISKPFIYLGFFKGLVSFLIGIKERTWKIESVFVVWFLIIFSCGCCMIANVNRLNGIYVATLFFLVDGIVTVLDLIKYDKVRSVFWGMLLGVYVLLFGHFVKFYFGGEYQTKYEPFDYFEYSLEKTLQTYEEIKKQDNRDVYVGDVYQAYIYFLSAKRISPAEYWNNENVNVEKLLNGEEYLNYKFYLPESIDCNSDYIVSKNNLEFSHKLEKFGFSKYESDYYNIYSFDLTEYQELEDEITIQWNAGVDNESSAILLEQAQNIDGVDLGIFVGWTYNNTKDCTWDMVYVEVDGKQFMFEMLDRTDVVESTKNEEILHSGIFGTIPIKDLENSKNVKIVCIDVENKVYGEKKLTVK